MKKPPRPSLGQALCPVCQCIVRAKNLRRHLMTKHGKAEYEKQKALYEQDALETRKTNQARSHIGSLNAIEGAKATRRNTGSVYQMECAVGKCSCGRTAIPGSDSCYTCSN